MQLSCTFLLRILIFQLFITSSLCAQHPQDSHRFKRGLNNTSNRPLIDTVPESDCSNGIDDNGNGLIDAQESHCYYYFDSIYRDCKPTDILWASSNLGIHWINLATNEERLVYPSPPDDYFVDIAWTPDGKLYAAGESHTVYEINPLTGSMKPIEFVSGYRPNGMTSDAGGMLYFTAYTYNEKCYLLKFDPLTNQAEEIVCLSDYGLFASGDCCFLNGYLFISCKGYIARVNIKTKLVDKIQIDNLVINDSWGITTIGDGYLYVSDNITAMYRLNTATIAETLVTRFNQPLMLISGFATYVDGCNAPCTKPRVSLGSDTVVCVNGTLLLNAALDRTVSAYQWSNGTSEKTNTITSPGTYWVKVSNNCETNADTIIVSTADKPLLSLGDDTVICAQRPLLLNNLKLTQPRDHFLWSDNSSEATLTITKPGTYWLKLSNVCGNVSDTIKVLPKIDNCECSVYIPTAFTPNNDGLNDRFRPLSECILKGNFQIFNRWGELIFQSEIPAAGWNGLFAGKPQPQGVYVYTLQFSYSDLPGDFIRKGTVTLVR